MPEITGRDDYITTKALFYAAHMIDGLPEQYQALSDRSDMIALLRSRLGDHFQAQVELFGGMLERATGRPFKVEG